MRQRSEQRKGIREKGRKTRKRQRRKINMIAIIKKITEDTDKKMEEDVERVNKKVWKQG